jgi:hypothetical protein
VVSSSSFWTIDHKNFFQAHLFSLQRRVERYPDQGGRDRSTSGNHAHDLAVIIECNVLSAYMNLLSYTFWKTGFTLLQAAMDLGQKLKAFFGSLYPWQHRNFAGSLLVFIPAWSLSDPQLVGIRNRSIWGR